MLGQVTPTPPGAVVPTDWAEPSRVAKLKSTSWLIVWDKLTVNVAVAVPLTGSWMDTSLIEIVGRSSSVIVPVAVPVPILALVAPDRVTKKGWFASGVGSPQT